MFAASDVETVAEPSLGVALAQGGLAMLIGVALLAGLPALLAHLAFG